MGWGEGREEGKGSRGKRQKFVFLELSIELPSMMSSFFEIIESKDEEIRVSQSPTATFYLVLILNSRNQC